MLRITRGSDQIEVRFDHMFCGPHEIKGLTGIDVEADRRCSLVTININDCFVSKGMIVCHPGDNFCRSTGRKKALAIALKSLSKVARTAVWTQYNIEIGF